MARITSGIMIKGTINNVCFYEMDGIYYLRMKPGPERKQFLNDSKYAPQRDACVRMNKGNKIASLIYKHIPKDKKVYKINSELQRMAALYFKTGLSVKKVTSMLCEWVVEKELLCKEGVMGLPQLASRINFADCIPGSGKRKDIDHFKGVQIRTLSGRWIRLYHMDDFKLLYDYQEEIEQGGESWVVKFLEKRKKLATYRLKHIHKRRYIKRRKVKDLDKVVSAVCSKKVNTSFKGVSLFVGYATESAKMNVRAKERVKRRKTMVKYDGILDRRYSIIEIRSRAELFNST